MSLNGHAGLTLCQLGGLLAGREGVRSADGDYQGSKRGQPNHGDGERCRNAVVREERTDRSSAEGGQVEGCCEHRVCNVHALASRSPIAV